MINTVIEYTIDNFSGILSVFDFKKHFDGNNYHWKDKRKKPPFLKNNLSGCYFLYNAKEEIIYIGKSNKCIRQRLISHLFKQVTSHDEHRNNRHDDKQKETIFFSYIFIEKDMVDIVEPFLIKKYSPKFNLEFIYAH